MECAARESPASSDVADRGSSRVLPCYNNGSMKGRAALGVLLAVTTALVVGPALAVSGICPDDADAGCCGLDCAPCLCCAQGPRTTLPIVSGAPVAAPAGSVGAEALLAPAAPAPRDILHVPKSLPSH